jgi:chromosome segregation ATPase
MSNLHTAANMELQKLRSEVEELMRAKAMLKGSLADAEEAKKKLKVTYEKMVTEGKQREEQLKSELGDVKSKLAHASSSNAALQAELEAMQQQLADAHARARELEGR